ILARGYKEDRRHKRWELDLIANRERLLALTRESRARMRREGVELITLADDRDPDVVNKIWRLSEEAGDDVPTTMPRIPETMESYVDGLARPRYIAIASGSRASMTTWSACRCSAIRRCAVSSERSGRRPLARCAAAASHAP